MIKNKPFYKIIDEICKEREISQKFLSYGWIRELEKDNKRHYIIKYKFDLNNNIANEIVNDKFATYEILRRNNIPTIEHKIIFNPETRSLWYRNNFIEDAKKLLKQNKNKLVIKANVSSKGKDVFYCSTENEIEEIIKKLFCQKKDTLSACPYLDIDYEYRVIYLDGEIIYIYKKKKPYVIGDGKSTLKQLIEAKYCNYKKIDFFKNINLNYIPNLKEEVTISWKHNLSNGAEPIIIDDNDIYCNIIKEIALKTAKAVNINFASIDVAVTSNNEILVMEVNGSVCMDKFSEIIPNGYQIAKKIYSKVFDKMFK